MPFTPSSIPSSSVGLTEYGYDQITANVNVASTTEATGTTIISCAAHTMPGTAVWVEFFCAAIVTPQATVAGTPNFVIVSLFEGATQITRLGIVLVGAPSAGGGSVAGQLAMAARYRFTPTQASHTYTVTAHAQNTTGTPNLQAGSGGTAAYPPCYIRFTN